MIDLGKYAGEVIFAYGATGGLIFLLCLWVGLRARTVKQRLRAAEARQSDE